MILGLHGAVIPQSDLLSGLKATASAGFQAYEPEVIKVAAARHSLTAVNTARRELGLSWMPLNEIEAFTPYPVFKPEEVLKLAAALPSAAVTVIPAVAANEVTLAEAAATLRDLAAAAKDNGTRIYFEMLAFPERAFHSLWEAAELAERSGIALVLDTFHLISSGASPERISRIPAELVGLVHISDALAEGRAFSLLRDADRVLPGEGMLPLIETMDAIRQTGFAGEISVEVFHPKYASLEADKVARDAYQRTTSLLSRSGWPRGSEKVEGA